MTLLWIEMMNCFKPPPPAPRGFRAPFLDPLSLLYWGLGQANQKRRNILNEQYSGTPLYEHL